MIDKKLLIYFERTSQVERVIKIIQKIRPDLTIEKDMKLIDDGILESYDVLQLIIELTQEFCVDIAIEDVNISNFNTVDSIYLLIKQLKKSNVE